MQRALERQAAWWFPRSIDAERGGFFEVYDPQGQPQSDNLRTLVFQCRQTWVASALAQTLPDQAPQLRQHVEHGLRFIRSHLADPERGGLFWARTFDGSAAPRVGDQKHAYGLAFAIYAGIAAEDAVPGAGGLRLAQETFAWLEAHAYDPVHGGYLEAFNRDGRPILDPVAGPDGVQRFDGLGTLFGRKSMNTHIHLLEAFAALYRVWPDPVLRERLIELDGIVRRRIFAEPGCLHLFFTRDWKPLPEASSFGHDVETAHLLIESARLLGLDDEQARVEPKRLVDHALEYGWDAEHGGFFDAGSAFGKARVEPKTWWVEAEALHALALMHTLYPDEPIYGQRLVEQWRFIERCQIDPADGAWYAAVSPNGAEVVKPVKAHRWKAGYHTVRSLIETLRILREGHASSTAEAPPPTPRPWTAMPAQAPDPGLFRFAVISDNSGGARPGVFPEAVRKLNLLQPDFIMSVGDFIEGYGADAGELDRQWARIQEAVGQLTPPFFYVAGNHDVAHPVMRSAWIQRFGVDRYHFVHRGVLMLCLDAQEIFPEGIAEPQIQYAERVLRDHADARWIFVFLHKPLWRKQKTGWERIEAALGDRPYTVFAGHIHNYKHEVRNGHDYFVLSVTGGQNLLRGVEKGDFDHVMWVTMGGDGPQYANILLDGVYDKALTRPNVSPLYSALQNDATVLVEPWRPDGEAADHATLHVANPADAPLRIAGEVLVGERVKPFNETIEPAGKATLHVPIDSLREPDDHPVRVRYELSYGVDAPGVLPVREPGVTINLAAEPVREIPTAPSPVSIDGALDEWGDLPWTVGPSPSADGAAAFALTTDVQNLYVAVRVNDDVLVGKKHDRPWGQDGVELRIDARPPLMRANGRGKNDTKQNDHLLIALALGDDPAKPPRPFVADQLPEGVVTVLRRDKRPRSGYAVEIAVPHAVLDRYRGGTWDGLRLNLTIDDLDIADDRPEQHWWRPDWRAAANVIGSGSFVRRDTP